MKYISDIQVDGEPFAFVLWPRLSPNTVITTHDIDTGVTEEVSDFPIDDCYGFSPRQSNGDCLVLRHTSRAAQLYKYIKLAKTKLNLHIANPGEDLWFLEENIHWEHNAPPDAATRTLILGCLVSKIEFYEPCSSIVHWEFNVAQLNIHENYIMSLYDFLIQACRFTGLNIMAYKAVRFVCDVEGDSTDVMFDHGLPGADVFFLKMYLEASKRSSS